MKSVSQMKCKNQMPQKPDVDSYTEYKQDEYLAAVVDIPRAGE
jgi:hypothetical protein